ncbi:hypothetical protein [Clostridium tyrobutyricum]|uniref:hypothetical protein n=1 Tax=Clostridium tyrobutyricum TaxID=1519 RepID=UPI0002DA75F8|nr:hypothetical protein [Clostridium tyrobutyricum]
MADTGNPEVKKNDVFTKGTTSTVGANSNLNTATSSNNNTKTDTPIPTVKINTTQPEIKYPIEDLIENSKALTGYGKEVAVGALFGSKEKEMTKDNFKNLIDTFLKRKVK